MSLARRTVVVAALAIAGLGFGANPNEAWSQQLRIGFANAEGIVPFMPEYAEISAKVQRHVQSSQELLQARADAFQADYERFTKQAELMATDARNARENELNTAYAALQQLGATKEQEALEYEQSLIQPLLDKVQAALDAVAKEKNLDLVLRAPGILYVKPETIVDITPDIARRLGVEVGDDLSVN